jgi:hypothetical protein
MPKKSKGLKNTRRANFLEIGATIVVLAALIFRRFRACSRRAGCASVAGAENGREATSLKSGSACPKTSKDQGILAGAYLTPPVGYMAIV